MKDEDRQAPKFLGIVILFATHKHRSGFSGFPYCDRMNVIISCSPTARVSLDYTIF